MPRPFANAVTPWSLPAYCFWGLCSQSQLTWWVMSNVYHDVMIGISKSYKCQTPISGGSRIFPRGVRQLPKMLLFFNFFAENCMKMKEFGPPGGVPGAPPWIRKCLSFVYLLPYNLCHCMNMSRTLFRLGE